MAGKGQPKKVESPEKMLELWKEYKDYVKANPRHIYQLDRNGQLVAVPHEVPLTQQGFEVHVYNNYGFHIGHYFDNKDKLYNDYVAICSHIRAERQRDQIEGGMVGQYNPSITQRLNNLKEQTDITTEGEKIQQLPSISIEIIPPTEE